jgi:hypothetical protein
MGGRDYKCFRATLVDRTGALVCICGPILRRHAHEFAATRPMFDLRQYMACRPEGLQQMRGS